MTTELVVATPALLFVLMLVVQFAVWLHATHVAGAVAAQALEATRVEGGSVARGHGQAATYLDQIGRKVLVGPQVEVSRSGEESRVTIRGVAHSVLPWLELPVEATAVGPTERFRSASDSRAEGNGP